MFPIYKLSTSDNWLSELVISLPYCYIQQTPNLHSGNAATMIPISHLPSHLSSPIIYSFVFDLKAPHAYSIPCMWIGLVLLLICSIVSYSYFVSLLEVRISNPFPNRFLYHHPFVYSSSYSIYFLHNNNVISSSTL